MTKIATPASIWGARKSFKLAREVRNRKRYVPRNRGSVEPVNVLEITRWIVRIAGPHTFLLLCIPFPTLSPSPPPPPSSLLLAPLSLSLRRRPVALIIREYVAVMLSIPPANSNRANPPTWWYRQEKWPHALQSQHFCVGCGRERGSSPRTRGSERERLLECLEETSLRTRFAAELLWFLPARATAIVQVRDPTKRHISMAGSPPSRWILSPPGGARG